MSRPLTQEQVLLRRAEQLLMDYSPLFEDRLLVLEACSSIIGGFDVGAYWDVFNISVSNSETIISIAKQLCVILSSTGIPIPLAISSLAREPIPIFEKKKNGAFYTDFRLAQFIAKKSAPYLKIDSRIADIAVGSGIIIAALAERYYGLFPENYNNWIAEKVFAYDLSEVALRGARIAMASHASSVSAIKRMYENWTVCDSLLVDNNHFPIFDIVVGNPPWGKVKLSRHSFINTSEEHYHVYGAQYESFDEEKFYVEKRSALNYSKALKERYSLLGDAEPDMYIVFLQKAISLLKPDGYLSYIVPAGLIRSLGTEPLRRYLLNSSSALCYYLFDNKAKFFEIDSRFKFVIVSQRKASSGEFGCNSFHFAICGASTEGIYEPSPLSFSIDELEETRCDLTIPECRDETEKALFFKISKNGLYWKDAWNVSVVREVDMTNNRALFHCAHSAGDIPVIEGRMVQQFRFGAKAYFSGSGRSAKWLPSAESGSVQAQFYVSPGEMEKQLLKRVNSIRAGYCDIAGQTNERAMMTAVIPPGVVCGNKVPTILFQDDEKNRRLYFFVAVTNSFVFDWMLRRVLSTTVNYFLLFSLPLPNIDLHGCLADRIVALAEELSSMGADYYTSEKMGRLRAELDVLIAMAYGLSFEELEIVLKDFPLLDRQQPAIYGESRSTYTRDLLLARAEEKYGRADKKYFQREKDGAEKQAKAYIPTEMVGLSRGGLV